MCGGTCPKTACTALPTDAGKALPRNDVSVKTGAFRFNHEQVFGCPHLKNKIVSMTQRQTRVGINGRSRADEEDELQHID